jgi:hypothetical protein
MSTYLEPGWLGRFAAMWEQLGPETRAAILDLRPDGWSSERKRALDFGCGTFAPGERQSASIGIVDTG